jgi:hypothetical protein
MSYQENTITTSSTNDFNKFMEEHKDYCGRVWEIPELKAIVSNIRGLVDCWSNREWNYGSRQEFRLLASQYAILTMVLKDVCATIETL